MRKKPALSTVDQINWWKDGNDIYTAEGTMFVIHKITARLFEARIGWHHQNTMPTDTMYTATIFQGKLKDCKAYVEQLWVDNYTIAAPCPRGWDSTETPMCEECSEDAIPSGIYPSQGVPAYSYCPPFTNEGELLLAGIWDTLDDDEPDDPIQAVWDRFDGPKPFSKDILPGESTLDRIADMVVLFVGLAWSIVGLA